MQEGWSCKNIFYYCKYFLFTVMLFCYFLQVIKGHSPCTVSFLRASQHVHDQCPPGVHICLFHLCRSMQYFWLSLLKQLIPVERDTFENDLFSFCLKAWNKFFLIVYEELCHITSNIGIEKFH